jgi:hypothetical protein
MIHNKMVGRTTKRRAGVAPIASYTAKSVTGVEPQCPSFISLFHVSIFLISRCFRRPVALVSIRPDSLTSVSNEVPCTKFALKSFRDKSFGR